MKIVILEDVRAGYDCYKKGAEPQEVNDVVAKSWIAQGKAVDPADAPAPEKAAKKEKAESKAPELTDQEKLDARVEELREEYTIPELRKMVKELTGEKPHHKLNEKTLATVVAEREAKG